jgi:hypothetical protein
MLAVNVKSADKLRQSLSKIKPVSLFEQESYFLAVTGVNLFTINIAIDDVKARFS